MSQIEKLMEDLSPEEYAYALEILKEYESTGSSESLNLLYMKDYEEIPVDIYTFMTNTNYLGLGLINEEGKFTVFPYWTQLLQKIYPDSLRPAICNTLALTGGIGLGKSFVAVIIGLYELYRMLCLRDPYLFYGLQPIDRISFVIANITLDAAKSVAWDKMQQLLQISPWFMNHGSVSGTTNLNWQPNKNIELITASLPRHYIGRAVFWAFFDEISFQPNSDINVQIEKAKLLVSTATARMQSRFMKGEVNPTILVLASSKRTEQSYMESFIQAKKKTESKTTIVIDEPQWIIRPDKDSETKFKVAIGNKFLSSEVVPLDATEQDLEMYKTRGYTLIDVPIGYYETFVDDINIALTDIAGISTTSSSRYFAGPRIAGAKNTKLQNMFTRDIIEVGNGPEDTTQYWDFIDLTRVDKQMLSKPLYIHLDMSLSGDKTGIAGVWIKGKKPTKEGEVPSKDLYYTTAFSVSVKAPKGYQVSFEKNRQFIRWLKQIGFKIKGVSCDTFQSADLLQQLKAEKFNCEIISVDRVKDGICLPYQTFRNAMYEQRFEMYNCELLTDELLGLEKDANGKIDHSPAGINSKDMADAVCGALFNASQHAEEYAYEYGEDLTIALDISSEINDFDFGQNLLNSMVANTAPRNPFDGILSVNVPPDFPNFNTPPKEEMSLAEAIAETVKETEEQRDERIRKQTEERIAEIERKRAAGEFSRHPNSNMDYNNMFNDGILYM